MAPDVLDLDLWKDAGIGWHSELDSSSSADKQEVAVEPTSSIKSIALNLTLDPELLRGTPLHVALDGFGKHWSGLASGPMRAGLYNLSRPVESIDVFLSHDWETSRWMKLLTLLLYFNSRAAAVASFIVSLLFASAKILMDDVLQGMDNLWMFSCYVVFLIFLFFWQRIRVIFCRPPWMVFLDKLCIHQEKDELKQKGILGLGAFVRASDRLLVLWSRRTFSRLWCAYEIGCFLSGNRPLDKLDILPVTMTAILFLNAVLWHILIFCYRWTLNESLASGRNGTPFSVIFVCLVVFPIAALILPVFNFAGMRMMDDVEQLPRQLQAFQIQSCQCFCCANHHKHPVSGEQMICDRELVYESLSDLYSRQGETNAPLEQFNRKVRERLGPRIVQKLRVNVPLKYLASLVMVSILPVLSELIWEISQGPQLQLQGLDYVVWLTIQILDVVQPCMAMIFGHIFSTHLWKLRHVSFFKGRLLCLSICLSPVQSILVPSLWVCFELAKVMAGEKSLVPVVPFLVSLVVNIVLHYL